MRKCLQILVLVAKVMPQSSPLLQKRLQIFDYNAEVPPNSAACCKSDATRFAAVAEMTSAVETKVQKRRQILVLIAKVMPHALPLLQK